MVALHVVHELTELEPDNTTYRLYLAASYQRLLILAAQAGDDGMTQLLIGRALEIRRAHRDGGARGRRIWQSSLRALALAISTSIIPEDAADVASPELLGPFRESGIRAVVES